MRRALAATALAWLCAACSLLGGARGCLLRGLARVFQLALKVGPLHLGFLADFVGLLQ